MSDFSKKDVDMLTNDTKDTISADTVIVPIDSKLSDITRDLFTEGVVVHSFVHRKSLLTLLGFYLGSAIGTLISKVRK